MENEPIHLDSPALILIEEHVRRLLATMGFAGATVHCQVEDSMLLIAVEAGDEGRALIGTQGIHLSALQHIVRLLLRSQLENAIRVAVDVNGYRARREQGLLQLAQEVARKAQRTGRTIVMKPMPAADRRAVHAALANLRDVRTESLGDEPNRRVVIKPIFL